MTLCFSGWTVLNQSLIEHTSKILICTFTYAHNLHLLVIVHILPIIDLFCTSNQNMLIHTYGTVHTLHFLSNSVLTKQLLFILILDTYSQTSLVHHIYVRGDCFSHICLYPQVFWWNFLFLRDTKFKHIIIIHATIE